MLHHLTHIWAEPDEGLWEVRGGARHFTHANVMAWVAFDRGIKAIETDGLKGPIDQWRAVRAAIHHDVCTRGFDRGLNSFVQSYGTTELDVSLLLIPQAFSYIALVNTAHDLARATKPAEQRSAS